jgi:hypothetical protein
VPRESDVAAPETGALRPLCLAAISGCAREAARRFLARPGGLAELGTEDAAGSARFRLYTTPWNAHICPVTTSSFNLIGFALKHALWAVLVFGAALAAPAVPVTFRVNMEFQTATEAFRPGADSVEARGEFNDWAGGFTLTNSPENTNIYQGTFDVTKIAPGNPVAYKFISQGSVWEETTPNPAANRSFILSTNAQVLPVCYFSDVWMGRPVPVTFRVNMALQIANTNFNPAKDVIEARGSFQTRRKWKAGFTLTNSPAAPTIYQGTYKVPLPPNAMIGYKFVIREPMDLTWESIPDRLLTITGEPQTLPVVYFNNEPESKVAAPEKP